jgi:CRP-like cAMP-binding protein
LDLILGALADAATTILRAARRTVQSSILIRKLESIAEVTEEQRLAIALIDGMARDIRRGEDVVSEGDRPSACTIVLSGLLCRYKVMPDGKRQIMAFHTPGDMPDLHSLFIQEMDHSLGSMTASTILTVPHDTMRETLRSEPSLRDLFWRDTLIDAAIFREWTVNVGRRSAYTRIAHLLCEVLVRMRAVGLADGDSCDLPLTQEDIGDAAGLSNVHVNRSLQELRAEGLVGGRQAVAQRPGLGTAEAGS